MRMTSSDFASRYESAFKRFIADRDEAALREAYEIGRNALENHVSLLEVLKAHESALLAMMRSAKTPEECERMVRVAESVLSENLVSFEMAQQGYLHAISALRRQADELRRSNEDLETFASVASHDLQEPLRKIGAFGELLRTQLGSNLDPQGLDYLNRMQNASERMSRKIQDLLRYARIGTGGAPAQSVDLSRTLRDVIDDLEPTIREARAEIVVEPLPDVAADPVLLSQLFQNLIANAVKFRNADRPPRVLVRPAGERGKLALISVEDNGIGFEQRFAERIFKPFQRLHGPSEYPGTGMGLAIARKIAQRFGGSLEARGVPGRGSTFTVALPRAAQRS